MPAYLRANDPATIDYLSRLRAHGGHYSGPLRLRAIPLGFALRNALEALQVRLMCNLYSITKNQEAIRDLFKVAHDIAGAVAVRRAKVG